MIEQTSVGSSGGELSNVVWHGLSRPEIEALGDQRVYSARVYIGQIDSDQSGCEENEKSLETWINNLLILFDINPN